MKPITNGTEKQIAYATNLRNKTIADTPMILEANSATPLNRRIALLRIHKLENCDDARTIIDWLTTSFHNAKPMIGADETKELEAGIQADTERFTTAHPKPAGNKLPLGPSALKRLSEEKRVEYETRANAVKQWNRDLELYLRDMENQLFTAAEDADGGQQ